MLDKIDRKIQITRLIRIVTIIYVYTSNNYISKPANRGHIIIDQAVNKYYIVKSIPRDFVLYVYDIQGGKKNHRLPMIR